MRANAERGVTRGGVRRSREMGRAPPRPSWHMRPGASGGTKCGLWGDPGLWLPVCRDAHPGHANAAASSTRWVLLWVWTGPHVRLWGRCSLRVSLCCGQGLSEGGRAQSVGGRVKNSVLIPVGVGSLGSASLTSALCLSLASPSSLQLSLSRFAHLSPRCFCSASPASYKPRLLAFSAPALPSATASRFPPSSHFSTSPPRPLIPGSRCYFYPAGRPVAPLWPSSSVK